MRRSIVLMLLFFLCAVVCYASEINLSLEKYSKKQDTITATDEIDKEKIENKNPIQALDSLSSMTGVFVQKTANTGRSDPVIRGFGDSCRKIALFIDGKPEKMALFGCGVSHSMLAGNIETIEVVKGPDSVLYGSGALGGVINIITKTPVKPLEGSIDISAGSFNTQNTKLYLGGIQKKVLYEAAVNKVISDGHLKNSQYNASDFYEKLGYIFDDGSMISVTAKQFSGLKYEPSPYPSGYWEDYRRGSVSLNYDRSFSTSLLALKTYTNYGEHEFADTTNDGIDNGWHSQDRLTGAIINYDMELTDENLLKTGSEFRQQEGKLLSGSSIMVHDGWKTSDWALFALDKHNFSDKLSAVAGVRYSDDEISGSFFSPRTGVEYKFTEIFLAKALYSKGFRAPHLNELYLVPAKNPNLKTEEINNYEIGLSANSDDFSFDVTGFVMKGDNLIESVRNVTAPPMYTFRNTGEFEFKGCEVSAGYIFTKNLNFNAGYTYFNAGKHTAGRPGSKIDADVSYKIGKWSFVADTMYIGEYFSLNNKQGRLNDFTIINAKVFYEVKEGIKLFADAQNITNQDYEMYLDREGGIMMQMPGAAVYFGTQIKF